MILYTTEISPLPGYRLAELDGRISEDDTFTEDVVAWAVIKAEFTMRWKRQ